MGRVAVVGLGNIGFRVLWELNDLGYDVVGVDSSMDAVERARSIGVEGRIGDVLSIDSLQRILSDVDLAVTALPGSIGYRAVRNVASLGIDVVDVSFFPEDPMGLVDIAERNGVRIIVDAGVAPGLSNMLVAMGVKKIQGRKARILVGGVSKKPDPPLGLASTWSSEDLIEEYVRPARAILDGRLVTLDPLGSNGGSIEFEGVGRLEYFPTDGLRSLLRTYGWMDELVEYTLRWPGHVEFMRNLKSLGFLDGHSIRVDSCIVAPRRFLAKSIERRYSDNEDIVALMVVVERDGGRRVTYRMVVEASGEWSAMAIATGGFQTAVARLLLSGKVGRRGLIFPEYIGESELLAGMVIEYLASRGITISESLL
ncbi:MAG: NAD-binding protein [Desulfurococcales archaeon]|nr:NAD-binding protein [Desulfurococcales archaeon]